jgi:hypothetical protein
VIRFRAKINKKSLSLIEKKIQAHLLTSERVRNQIINIINKSISIQKWRIFLAGDQFQADFGLDPASARTMEVNFDRVVKDVVLVRDQGGVNIRGIDQDVLRIAMDHVWTNSKGRKINVNVWDAYEYGKIGSKTGGRIFGHHVAPVKTPQGARYSRSGLAVMKPGGSFSVNKGAAPGIGAVRLDMNANKEIISTSLGRIIRGSIKI